MRTHTLRNLGILCLVLGIVAISGCKCPCAKGKAMMNVAKADYGMTKDGEKVDLYKELAGGNG